MSIMLTTVNTVSMNQAQVSFTHPLPHEGQKLSKLGSSPNTTIHSKVRNNNVTSPSPICPCCMSNEKKKHTTFQTLSKGSIVISSISFVIEKDWLYIILSQKQRIWMMRGQSYTFFFLSSSRSLVLREAFCCNYHSRSKLV